MTSTPASETVTRLYRALVDALDSERPDSTAGQPVTVAEIYQSLVPYRRVRARLGVELNADYEHALMRLLAGVGGYVRLDPDQARDELRRELESSNPNVGIFRKFAACDVRVRRPDGGAEEAGADAGREQASPVAPEPRRSPPAAAPDDTAAADANDAPSCTFCDADLPTDRKVRYCPFCGADQERQPCPECGEMLEADWRYCIACGYEATSSGP